MRSFRKDVQNWISVVWVDGTQDGLRPDEPVLAERKSSERCGAMGWWDVFGMRGRGEQGAADCGPLSSVAVVIPERLKG